MAASNGFLSNAWGGITEVLGQAGGLVRDVLVTREQTRQHEAGVTRDLVQGETAIRLDAARADNMMRLIVFGTVAVGVAVYLARRK